MHLVNVWHVERNEGTCNRRQQPTLHVPLLLRLSKAVGGEAGAAIGKRYRPCSWLRALGKTLMASALALAQTRKSSFAPPCPPESLGSILTSRSGTSESWAQRPAVSRSMINPVASANRVRPAALWMASLRMTCSR